MVSTTVIASAFAAMAATSMVSAVPASNAFDTPKNGREKAQILGVNRETCYYVLGDDISGNDVANKPSVSFRGCDNICFAEEKCTTWTWTNYNGGTCWLKSYRGGSTGTNGAISLSCSLEKYTTPINNTTSAPDTYREDAWFNGVHHEPCYFDHNVDRPGNDLTNKPASSFRDCTGLCFIEKGCDTWAWTDYNGGTCWLKSHNGASVPKTGAVSLTCSIEKYGQDDTVCTKYEDIDFVGNDIGSKKGLQYECCGICDKTQGCSAYAWNFDNGGTCYLKSSVGHVVYKAGVISSSIKPLYGPVCPFEYDTDYAGKDIGNKPAKDAGVCCSLCKENAACKAYTWSNFNGGTCWMKSGRGESRKAVGVISATLFPARY